MKILAVKLKNINTLLGEWEIHFDRPPLSDTGLFAIVGPNGSGKSSILDGLTLALYGETSRLRSPESGILHWPSEEACAEVTFTVGDTTYRSRWSVRKSGGSWESPEMLLSGIQNGDETLLEDRMIRVRSRIAELTGLDFKRFCRSVLLAQGDFAAFLNALENERAEILEKIMGSEMAEELENCIARRAREEEEKLLQLKEAAVTFPMPAKSRINELRQSHEESEEELRRSGERLRELQELKAQLELKERLETESLEATASLAAAEDEWSEARLDAQKLERAWPASSLRGTVDHLDGLMVEMDAARDSLNRLQRDLPVQEAQLVELEGNLQETTKKLQDVTEQLEERGGELRGALESDREIDTESQRFLDLVSRYEAVERSQKENVQQQAQVKERLPQVESGRDEILRWLEGRKADEALGADLEALGADSRRLNEIDGQIAEFRIQRQEPAELERDAAKTLEKAERALLKAQLKADRLNQRRAGREQFLDELLEHSTFESVAAALKEQKKKLSACRELAEIVKKAEELGFSVDTALESARIEAERDSASEALSREQAALDELDGQIRWRDLVRRLSAERAALDAGAPCPLCGSEDHPFVEQEPPDFSELDRIVEERVSRIQTLRNTLEALQNESESILSRSGELHALEQQWRRVCEKAVLDWTMRGSDEVLEEIRSLEDEIRRWSSNLRAARWIKWRNRWLGWAQRRRMKTVQRRERARNGALQQHEARQRVLDEIDGAVQRLKKEEESIRTGIGVRVQPYGERSPDEGTGEELIQRLMVRREEYRRQRSELEKLGEELQNLNAQREALPREHEQLREEAESLAAETESLQARLAALKGEREARYGTLDPEGELRTLEGELDRLTEEERALAGEVERLRGVIGEGKSMLPQWARKVEESESAYAEAEAGLREEMVAAGFADVGAVRAQLEVLDDSQAVLDRVAAAEKRLAAAKSRAAELRAAFDALSAEPVTDETPERVRLKFEEAEKHHASVRARWDEEERYLADYREAEHEHREILASIAVQEKLIDEILAEQKVLRERDAAEAQRKRQRLMMSRLIEQTNEHLALLSGRYLLRSVEGDGLGIEVEDSLQDRTRRPVRTLSGGESFVVSLCLALGLSEMAARHRKIESLFLDEGFGALDEEMLYRVVAALKNLRANGKMVGIISHVKRLADEIPTQIRVDKIADGSSSISIVA
jgi:exonuclease SbcC